jgi:hypothetical protein
LPSRFALAVRRTTLAGPLAALLVAAVCVAGAPLAGATTSHARLPSPPPIPKNEPAAIESFAPYQPQFYCRTTVEPGVKAFESLVLATYKNTGSDGDMRGCDVGGTSEHKDGRAWDWRADYRIPKERAAGKSMLRWLFATDAQGNKDAMFRRLGLMYIIWNHRIWEGSWKPYACSGVTLCHVNHMHFSFGWAGAERKTSYWTGKVSPVMEPPLPVLSKVGQHRALTVEARTGTTDAMWLLKGGDTYRVQASGVWRDGKGKNARADAVCTRTAHGWQRSPNGGIGVGGDQLQSWGEQWVPTVDNGNGCNTTSHTYRLVLSPQSSSTVVGQLSGAGQSTDSGSVTLKFSRTA